RCKGFREIRAGQTGCEGVSHVCVWLTIPSEEPADEETDAQERAHDWRGRERHRAGGPQELIERDVGAYPWQIDGPHIMQRHAGKKVVDPQGKPLELLRRDLWHRALLVGPACAVSTAPARLGYGPAPS